MNGPSKLSSEFSMIWIVQPVIALIIFSIVWGFFGITSGLIGLALIFGVYGLISLAFLRQTENLWYLAPFAVQTTVILFALLAPIVGVFPINISSFGPLIIMMAVLMVILIYVLLTKKLRWRGREILELAAQNVEDATNGFTGRPKPLGHIEFSPSELSGFILFIKSNLVAWPREEKNRLILILIGASDEYRLPLGISDDYSENSWVAFDKEGNVSVQISKKDYIKYKKTLAFDQLVESMGKLFIRFFEQYKNGEEKRIIFELNSVSSFPFS